MIKTGSNTGFNYLFEQETKFENVTAMDALMGMDDSLEKSIWIDQDLIQKSEDLDHVSLYVQDADAGTKFEPLATTQQMSCGSTTNNR